MDPKRCIAITRAGFQCLGCVEKEYGEYRTDYCNKHKSVIKRKGSLYFEKRQITNISDLELKTLRREHPFRTYEMIGKEYEIKSRKFKKIDEIDKKMRSDPVKYNDELEEARRHAARHYNKLQARRWRRQNLRFRRLREHVIVDTVQEPRTLADFAADAQNIHTVEAVNHTKEMIELIRKIPVPEEYQWNMGKISKTMTDILSQCDLTPASVWQMTAKYCSDDTIYDLENGIYGKVLDSVWQYIIKSEHKDDLIKILKTELADNIGMCAQGNLSRLCNVLTGYLDGLSPEVDRHAQFCDRMAKISEMDDMIEQYILAFRLFDKYGTSKEDIVHWLDALHDMNSVD